MQAVLGNTSRHGVAREAGAEGVGEARSGRRGWRRRRVGVGGERRRRGTDGEFSVFQPAIWGYFYVAPLLGKRPQNGRSLSAVFGTWTIT